MKQKVLFLCTGNSCRSQMAEAIVNDRMSDTWEASSAGIWPAGYFHPKTLQVLREIGIFHEGRSKYLDEFRDVPLDLVITVCDAASTVCPSWLGSARQVHMGFEDPANIVGGEAALLDAFRKTRDQIADQIPAFLNSLSSECSARPLC